MTEQMPAPFPARRPDHLPALLLALASLGLYSLTLAPTVLEGDAGEFQFVPWLPGIAHPTGYPLYTLLGWAWSRLLPLGEVAWRLNLLSALLAAITVGLTYYVARDLLAAARPHTPPAGLRVAAAGTALIFALTPTFWSQALVAEVYSLHALLVAAAVGLALRWRLAGYDPAGRPARWLALTLGLGLAHHRTTVLLLPALALLAWRFGRQQQAGQRTWQAWGWLAFLMVLPLLLYLYLPLIAPATPYATLSLSDSQTLVLYDNSWSGFWDHVMGRVFSGAVRPAEAGLERLALAGQLLRQELGWAGIILAGLGLLGLIRDRQGELLLLTGLTWLALVTFNLIYFIGDVFVLFIPAWWLVTLWAGLGGLIVADVGARAFVRRGTTSPEPPVFDRLNLRLSQGIYTMVLAGLVSVLLLGVAVSMMLRHGPVSQAHNTTARDRWQQILAEPLPPGAVLLSNDRNEIMPMWYEQYVHGRRPDLLGLFPLIVTDPAYATVGGVLNQALASGRPVYLIKAMPGLSLKADLSPAGTLFRADAIPARSSFAVEQTLLPVRLDSGLEEAIRLVGYDLSPQAAGPGQTLEVSLFWQPVQPLTVDYTSYIHLADAAGQGLTQSDHRPGGVIYPSSQWQVGERLRDRHRLTLPPEIEPGQYRLRAGMYTQLPSGEIRGMGPGVEIGSIQVR